MYHALEFLQDFVVDLAISPKQPLERIRIKKGSRMLAQVKPYVVETITGPVEVADLFFADGTSTSGVRCEWFSFVDA